jgi:hypothetical protein
LRVHLQCVLHPSVPNVHGNGVAERSNRRLHACLSKSGVSDAAFLPAAVSSCVASLNESPTARLRWKAAVDVRAMPDDEQRELATHVRQWKSRNRQRRDTRRHRQRRPLPAGPTPYLVRDVAVTHPYYEGPYIGYECHAHGVNCRRVWRDRWRHISPVLLKVYRGSMVPPMPPPPRPLASLAVCTPTDVAGPA